ncbi:nucleotide exchange factor GrpE [Ornithinimicrobium sp. Y1847]|uniref:nucleotide exchange factor GrpE n=1 Tax=unclassified Ornithinimicrobium TaxID=2615080 RepID=UPI003B66D23F
MTDVHGNPSGGADGAAGEEPRTGPVIRDKRRIDPDTGERRPDPAGNQVMGADTEASEGEADSTADAAAAQTETDGQHPDTALAAERLEEMRRMQAEHVNFRNRIQREREADKGRATSAVVESLLPVLDDIHSAREHGDLEEGTPFAAIAAKLEQALGRFGVERTGFVGEVFDPALHEALMHLTADSPGVELPEGATEMTIVQVMQPGFKVGDQVVRAARVAVADPA